MSSRGTSRSAETPPERPPAEPLGGDGGSGGGGVLASDVDEWRYQEALRDIAASMARQRARGSRWFGVNGLLGPARDTSSGLGDAEPDGRSFLSGPGNMVVAGQHGTHTLTQF